MLNKNNKNELKLCIENIEKWFDSDTIILLDCVLTDDPDDPEYSANTAYYRLEDIIHFKELYYGVKYKDVADYMLKNGYSQEDIQLLNHKRIEENKRHSFRNKQKSGE